MIGLRFDRVVVLDGAGLTKQGQARWRVQCDCGSIFERNGGELRKPNSIHRCRSCYSAAAAAKMTRHGETDSPLWRAWENMLKRVSGDTPDHKRGYADRGITVCDEWAKSYESFRNYVLSEVGPKPEGDFSLDRIDNDGNYQPGNIRWATRLEQARNRRKVYARGSERRLSRSKKYRERQARFGLSDDEMNLIG